MIIDVLQVPVAGLEPARELPRRILNPLRLPIPPHRQETTVYKRVTTHPQSSRKCFYRISRQSLGTSTTVFAAIVRR